jgi:NAD(P)-dependent dehydrogenase (short-subunit alcohol dehydrogenase family)
MRIADRTVLVTGANRGLGKALVEEALKMGAARVYAGTRRPYVHRDDRVTVLKLDVTNATQIQRSSEEVDTLDILINNAGIAQTDDLSDRVEIERHLAVKLFGTHDVTQAFLPLLVRSRGAIVTVVSRAALTPLPRLPAYSIADAAAFSLTLSLRALLRAQGVSVHAVLPASIDTDMSRGFDTSKSSPQTVARGILVGLENGEAEIFPDPTSATIAEDWRAGVAKMLERQFAPSAA